MSWATRMRKHKRPPANVDALCPGCGAKWTTNGETDFLCLMCKTVIPAKHRPTETAEPIPYKSDLTTIIRIKE